MEKFINDIKTKGWMKALDENKVPNDFWIKNFNNLPNDYGVRNAILHTQPLSEDFIVLAFKQGWMEDWVKESPGHNQNWSVVSSHQILSEDFMEAFEDKLDWFFISIHQKLSKSFIEKHKDKLDNELVERWQK